MSSEKCSLTKIHAVVSRRLRERRDELGMTLADVAEKSGLSIGTISQYEGKGDPGRDYKLLALVRICEAIQMPVSRLFVERPDPEQAAAELASSIGAAIDPETSRRVVQMIRAMLGV